MTATPHGVTEPMTDEEIADIKLAIENGMHPDDAISSRGGSAVLRLIAAIAARDAEIEKLRSTQKARYLDIVAKLQLAEYEMARLSDENDQLREHLEAVRSRP